MTTATAVHEKPREDTWARDEHVSSRVMDALIAAILPTLKKLTPEMFVEMAADVLNDNRMIKRLGLPDTAAAQKAKLAKTPQDQVLAWLWLGQQIDYDGFDVPSAAKAIGKPEADRIAKEARAAALAEWAKKK